ncbi:peptide chain release factor [Microdochium nivale]|nr:peptide chain release factor [Microdochium nivale]
MKAPLPVRLRPRIFTTSISCQSPATSSHMLAEAKTCPRSTPAQPYSLQSHSRLLSKTQFSSAHDRRPLTARVPHSRTNSSNLAPTSSSSSSSSCSTTTTARANTGTGPGLGPFRATPALHKQAMPQRPKPPPDDEFEEYFLKGSGPGGQKINKTSSAVQLLHKPSGIVVKSQATRSRSQNRKIARQLLADKLDVLENGDNSRAAIVGSHKAKKKASSGKKSRRKYRKLAEGQEQEQEHDTEDQDGAGDADAASQGNIDRQAVLTSSASGIQAEAIDRGTSSSQAPVGNQNTQLREAAKS